MTVELYNLIIVAHPDDETIYFSGPLMKNRDYPWKVICITNGNADGNGKARLEQFEKACIELKVEEFERWDYPDIFEERLDTNRLIEEFLKLKAPLNVYTHGIIGEYSHPHHQDVSYAVHKAFYRESKVLSVSYNTYPDEVIELSKEDFTLKTHILSQIYADEMNRFLHLVPATPIDTFSIVELTEVEAIYNFLTQQKNLNIEELEKYKWLYEHIKLALATPNKRLF